MITEDYIDSFFDTGQEHRRGNQVPTTTSTEPSRSPVGLRHRSRWAVRLPAVRVSR